MKYLKLAFIGIFLTSAINALAVINNPGGSNSVDATGTVIRYDQQHIFVKHNGTDSKIYRGTPVVLDSSEADGYTITTSSSSPGASVLCILDENVESGNWAKCLKYGYMDAASFGHYLASWDATANEALYHCDADARLCAVNDPALVGPWKKVGFAIESKTATGTIKAYIQL